MRLKGRQARFVCGTIGGWFAARLGMLGAGAALLAALGLIAGLTLVAPSLLRWPSPVMQDFHAVHSARRTPPAAPVVARSPAAPDPPLAWEAPEQAPQLLRAAFRRLYPGTAQAALRHAVFAPAPADAPDDAAPSVPRAQRSARVGGTRRWAAEAYLFVRPGGGRPSLAAGGQLGGSQAAARLTYRLNRQGPVRAALAARIYAPLRGRGREAAVGLDWHPLPAIPLRLSVERRVALDRAGRNAWSAYAAGGFYREPLPGVLVVDGYAQAGVVGAHARDLFVDGAIRTGWKLPLGQANLVVGAGAWGAAQPGVARLDLGPRLGAVLPVGDHAVSLAIEGRLRVAGHASPGSGAALTLGVDF